MKVIRSLLSIVDRWQQAHLPSAVAYAVVKKFGDDQSHRFVVALGWYGFIAIYPLLLIVITILGFIGAASLGHQVLDTLHEFPVVGSQFNPQEPSASLHGSTVGLIVGLLSLIYGAQGVTQSVLQALAQVWNVPMVEMPGFASRLWRSLIGLVMIGGAFLASAALATIATSAGSSWWLRVLVVLAMAVVNALIYWATFCALTPGRRNIFQLVPGAGLASLGFTLLITVGSGLVQHQLRHSTATYGQFGIVIGLVGFLFLVATITLYGAELNPVLARRLWPRSFGSTIPTTADDRILYDLTHQTRRRADQRIGVGFGERASDSAARDALEATGESS